MMSLAGGFIARLGRDQPTNIVSRVTCVGKFSCIFVSVFLHFVDAMMQMILLSGVPLYVVMLVYSAVYN